MTSDNPKDELQDIFGGNSAKKVEPIDDEYDFGDIDLGMVPDEEIELELIEDESDETAEAVDAIMVEPETADEAFSDDPMGDDELPAAASAEDAPTNRRRGSHWDSLAATLGLETDDLDDGEEEVLEKMFVPPTARAADLEAELSGPPSKKSKKKPKPDRNPKSERPRSKQSRSGGRNESKKD